MSYYDFDCLKCNGFVWILPHSNRVALVETASTAVFVVVHRDRGCFGESLFWQGCRRHSAAARAWLSSSSRPSINLRLRDKGPLLVFLWPLHLRLLRPTKKVFKTTLFCVFSSLRRIKLARWLLYKSVCVCVCLAALSPDVCVWVRLALQVTPRQELDLHVYYWASLYMHVAHLWQAARGLKMRGGVPWLCEEMHSGLWLNLDNACYDKVPTVDSSMVMGIILHKYLLT